MTLLKPVISLCHEVPIHLCEKFDKLLLEFQAQDITEDVSGPVKWILNPVLAPIDNPDEIQFTFDMNKPIKVIKWTPTIMPTIEDVQVVFRGATLFSKIDVSSLYFQFKLTEESWAPLLLEPQLV